MKKLRSPALLLSLLMLLSLCLPVSALAAPLTMYNVWATWCPPCREELPALGRIAREYAGRVEVIGLQSNAIFSDWSINQQALDEGNALFAQSNATYPNRVPTPNDYWLLSRSEYVPATYFVDGNGKIVKEVVGGYDYDGWVWVINKLLEAPPSSGIPGDADNNWAVDLKDLTDLIDYLVEELPLASLANADADDQPGVTPDDALWLIRQLAS